MQVLSIPISVKFFTWRVDKCNPSPYLQSALVKLRKRLLGTKGHESHDILLLAGWRSKSSSRTWYACYVGAKCTIGSKSQSLL